MKYFFFIFLLALLVTISCKRREEKITNSSGVKLFLSQDTIIFDTLLSGTQKGSITKRLIVSNRNKNAVKISSIQLGGMANSPYKLIVNGKEGFYNADLEIRGGDSIYILVSIAVPIGSAEAPFLIIDSLVFNTNNNIQKVQLITY